MNDNIISNFFVQNVISVFKLWVYQIDIFRLLKSPFMVLMTFLLTMLDNSEYKYVLFNMFQHSFE